MNQPNILVINIVQLFIPFLAFGDKATNLWFIGNVAQ
jgi:hypothetical protein